MLHSALQFNDPPLCQYLGTKLPPIPSYSQSCGCYKIRMQKGSSNQQFRIIRLLTRNCLLCIMWETLAKYGWVIVVMQTLWELVICAFRLRVFKSNSIRLKLLNQSNPNRKQVKSQNFGLDCILFLHTAWIGSDFEFNF